LSFVAINGSAAMFCFLVESILPRFEFALQFARLGTEEFLDFGFRMALKRVRLLSIGVALFELHQTLAFGVLELALQRQEGIFETSRFIQELSPQFRAGIDFRSKVAQRLPGAFFQSVSLGQVPLLHRPQRVLFLAKTLSHFPKILGELIPIVTTRRLRQPRR
jgi:hypothetical protein